MGKKEAPSLRTFHADVPCHIEKEPDDYGRYCQLSAFGKVRAQ